MKKEKEINEMYEQLCLELGVIEKGLQGNIKITGGPLSEIRGMDSFQFKISESDYQNDSKVRELIKENMVKRELTGCRFIPYNISIHPDTTTEIGDPKSGEFGLIKRTLSTDMNVVIRGCKLAEGWCVDNTEDDYTMLLVNSSERQSVKNYYQDFNFEKNRHIDSIENVSFYGRVKNWFVKTFRKDKWMEKIHFPRPHTPHTIIMDSIKMDIHVCESDLGTLFSDKHSKENAVHMALILVTHKAGDETTEALVDRAFKSVNKETDILITDTTKSLDITKKRQNILRNSSEHLYQNLVEL